MYVLASYLAKQKQLSLIAQLRDAARKLPLQGRVLGLVPRAAGHKAILVLSLAILVCTGVVTVGRTP